MTLPLSIVCCLAKYVANMSPTRVNVAKSWPTLRVVATQKRDTNAQFISTTADKSKSAQTYGYLSTIHFLCLSSKELPTCNDMSAKADIVVSFWTPCRHDIFLCLRHDQRRGQQNTSFLPIHTHRCRGAVISLRSISGGRSERVERFDFGLPNSRWVACRFGYWRMAIRYRGMSASYFIVVLIYSSSYFFVSFVSFVFIV